MAVPACQRSASELLIMPSMLAAGRARGEGVNSCLGGGVSRTALRPTRQSDGARAPGRPIRLAGMHLELAALVVDDYDRAIEFFVDVLGFDLVEDSPSLTNDGRPK